MSEGSRRDQILEAARVLFREKGYHATTIRDIAEMTGMLSGSLYAHIRTKEDLLYEITDQIADQFLDSMERALQSTESPITQYRSGLEAHIRVVARNLDAATVFSHEWRGLSQERQALIRSKRDRYEQLWESVLDAGIRSGDFRPEHSRFARMVTLSVANWLYQWYDPTGKLSSDEIAERLSAVLLQGIQK